MDIQKKKLKKTLTIIKVIMVCTVLFMIYCGISLSRNKSSMEECSSVMLGVVTDVDKKNDTRHGYYYKAYVTSEDAPGMKFESPSVKHEYIKGESVKIHYDPDDISDYYIEGAEPIGQDVSMIFTLLFLLIVLFIGHIKTGKQYRKLCSE
jgi:hypothetical protein